jgi:hypothetical protein
VTAAEPTEKPAERGRHEREAGSRVVTLELSQARIECLVAGGLLDGEERDDRAIAAALKALIDSAAAPAGGRDLCVPVMLDPEAQVFLLDSQFLPIHGRADRHGMARVLMKLLDDARGHWLQFNAPRSSMERVVSAAAPLTAEELAAIRADRVAEAETAARRIAPVRVVPREAQKAYLRSWRSTGAWPREWGPPPDQPGTVVVDEDVRAVFGLDPVG